MITAGLKKEYLACGGSFCLYCRSVRISGDSPESIDNDKILRVIRCMDCGRSWDETYDLVDVKESEAS